MILFIINVAVIFGVAWSAYMLGVAAGWNRAVNDPREGPADD